VYCVHAPEEVGSLNELIPRLRVKAGPEACVVLGFDFAIGLPHYYAQQAGIPNFKSALAERFGKLDWSRFFDVADKANDISLKRPFYPFTRGKKGQHKKQYLLEKLQVPTMDALLRKCERKHDSRAAANCLFWTLGANQVGKGAICGWRDVILPALELDPQRVRLWPFDGCDFAELLQRGCAVIAETYPAEYYERMLGNRKQPWSKDRQDDRRAVAEAMLKYAENANIRMDKALQKAITGGFGSSDCGQDRFDAVVGLLVIIEVVTGRRTTRVPDNEHVQNVEGWILGQENWA
jgi:hypothetical protein